MSFNGVEIDLDLHGPIDLAHLSDFTHGNRFLEQKILGVFVSEVIRNLEELSATSTIADWGRQAHSLKNTASSVGAWHIAYAAGIAEELKCTRNSRQCIDALARLQQLAKDAMEFIRDQYSSDFH